MGHHYNPQHYLKGWEIPSHPGIIWQYDKKLDTFKDLPIKGVANERGYYSDVDERKLANEVEAPAQPAIEKLRAQLPLSNEERGLLSFYISTMMSRGPRHREKFKAAVPFVLEEITTEVRTCIAQAREDGVLSKEMEEKRLAEVNTFKEKCAKQLPPEIQERMMDPRTSEERHALIYNMTWRVLTANGPSYFITSDNPVHFFEGHGLIHRECEFVFPITTTVLIHGCWQRQRPGEPWLFPAPQWFVREFNRRVASQAVRFVFYHQKSTWIRSIVQNSNPALTKGSRINNFVNLTYPC